MVRYVLIGIKVESKKVVKEDILGYFTDAAALFGEMEDAGTEYNKFFVGREERPALILPVSDTTLESISKDL